MSMTLISSACDKLISQRGQAWLAPDPFDCAVAIRNGAITIASVRSSGGAVVFSILAHKRNRVVE